MYLITIEQQLFVTATKVSMPYLVLYLNRAPIFKWCVIKLDPQTEPNKTRV